MKSVVVIIPRGGPPSEHWPEFEQPLRFLSLMASAGSTRRLRCESELAESFGMPPGTPVPADGPLVVSALKEHPPGSALQMKLEVCSFDSERISQPFASAEERRTVLEAAKTLRTSRLTVLPGSGSLHALVAEETSPDIRFPQTVPESLGEAKPQGDGELQFHRFLDDSLNLLAGLEVNRIREDKGLPPLNLLVPHSAGSQLPAPNLALQRGIPALYSSQSFRLAGWSRWLGYRHLPFNSMGRSLDIDWKSASEAIASPLPVVLVFPQVRSCQLAGQFEEANWLWQQIDDNLWRLLAHFLPMPEHEIQLLIPHGEAGLAFSGPILGKPLPIGEPLHLDGTLPQAALGDVMREALTAR